MPETHFATTQTELLAALELAQAGDRIELAAGSYGHLDLYDARSPFIAKSDTVTIASQDASAPARFSKVTLTGAQNLTFEGLVFDYDAPDGPQYDKPFLFQNSSGLVLRDVTVQGTDPAVGQGINIKACEDVQLNGLTVTSFHRGIVVTGSKTVSITGSELSDMGSDGIDMAGVETVAITDNVLRDFAAPLDDTSHRDFIQFWTAGGAGPSSDVLISGNQLIGPDVQAIFMRSETTDATGAAERYADITISNNAIYTDDWHGIHTPPTDELSVTGNTVLPYTIGHDDSQSAPVIFVEPSSTGVSVARNVTTGIGDATAPDWASWTDGNLILQYQSPGMDGYLPDFLLLEGTAQTFGPHKLAPSMVHADMGAAASHVDVTRDQARVQVIGDGHGEFHLDATASSFGGAYLTEDTATFSWTLPNGARMSGPTLGLKLAEGQSMVTLAIDVGDQQVLTREILLDVGEQTALAVVATEAGVVAEIDGSPSILDAATTTVLGQPGLVLRPGHSLTIDPGDSFDMRDFLIAFDFALTDPDATGHIMRVHGDWLLFVTPEGGLEFWFWDIAGTRSVLQTQDVDFRDGVMRHVAIAREFDTGNAAILIDGVVASQGEVSGLSGPEGSHDLVIGDIFSWTSATGWMDNLAIDHALPAAIAETVAPESHWIVLDGGAMSVFGDAPPQPETDPVLPTSTFNVPQVPVAPVTASHVGTSGKDKLRGSDDADGLLGGDGKDVLFGKKGDDQMFGEDGNDRLYGGKGQDTLVGGDGKDKLHGNQGNDALFGGSGNDNLRGGDGDDLIHGGAGRDLLSGGNGADIFVVQMMGGYDTVYDFTVGEDSLALLDVSVADLVLSDHAMGTALLVSEDDMMLFKGLYDLDIWDLILV